MANVYVDSAAAGAGTGADWANAYTTLSVAVAAKAAGDDFWVASSHNETTAGAVTITCPGTLASPCRIVSVNKAGSVPPVGADVLSGARVSNTTAANLTVVGHFYCYGVIFSCSDGANAGVLKVGNNTRDNEVFDACDFISNTTNVAGGITTTSTSARTEFRNCRFKFGATNQTLSATGDLRILGGSIISGTSTPAFIFTDNSAAAIIFEISGMDLSNLAATVDFIRGTSGGAVGKKNIRNCKLPAAWSGHIFNITPTVIGSRGEMYNCDSGNTNYRLWIEDYAGTIKQETTIVRTSGASDGTTPFSWIMVSSANSDGISNQLKSPEFFKRNETTGASKTLTVEIIHSGVGAGTAGAFTDQEIWLEVEYLGTSGFPLTTVITDRAATIITTAADQTSSTTTWTSSPATPVKQSLGVTFTPQVKGMYIARVCLATASKTVYIDPVITVS